MKLLAHLERKKECWLILGILIVFFFLRLPSLFEPHWYGDEGIYQVIGDAVNKGRLLYSGIWDNKPPLLYALYALFGADQFMLRFVSLFFGLGAVVSFSILAHLLFSSTTQTNQTNRIILTTTALFAVLFGLPLLEGNIANSENFMLFPTLVAGICILQYVRTRKSILLVTAGILLSLNFLLKAVAVFDLAAFTIFTFIATYRDKQHIISQIKSLIPLGIGFFIPIGITTLIFSLQGNFSDFINAAFLQTAGYVGYGNRFIIPQGFLYLKLVLLGIFSIFLFINKSRIPQPILFTFLWVAYSLFNAFFSQRPYTHYVLVLLPSLCLLMGVVWKLSELQTQKSKIHAQELRKLYLGTTFGLVIIILLAFKGFSIYSKNISYYINFVTYITGNKDTISYRNFFDRNTSRDYDVAQFLKTHMNQKDNVFLWGNNAQIYRLADKLPPGRFTVAYHITASDATLQETQQDLATSLPKYLVIIPSHAPFPYQMTGYVHRLSIEDALIYERIF